MGTDKKTIQSYNNYAKQWIKRLKSGENIAHKYLEKPAMYSKLPDLKDKTVLCVGCGSGEECKHIKTLGAKRVVGIDISKELIKYAKESCPEIEFYVMDMEKINFPQSSFDFAYSSLTIHYVKDWSKTLKSIFRVLKKGGRFLFSTHHPVKWGAKVERTKKRDLFLMGYAKYKKTDRCEVYGDYLNIRKINDIWFNEFKVVFFHKPFSSIIKEILESGFEIIDFLEPKPIEAVKKKRRGFWEIHQKIPLFMIFELKKRWSRPFCLEQKVLG